MKRLYVILIVSVLALTAGCIDPDAVVTVEKLNDTTEVAESASLDLEDVNPSAKQAVLNGSSDPTVRKISDSMLVSYDGEYYAISRETAGTDSIVIADINVSETEVSANYTADELPSQDIKPIHDFKRYADQDVPRGILNQRYTPDNINDSVLLQEEDIIVGFEGKNYRLKVNGTEERTEDLFTYSSEIRFESSEVYYDHIEDNYMFELEEIPNGSEEVWNEAVEDGYYGDSTDGFEKLKERFEQEDAFEKEEYNGQWYVRYNEEMYKVNLDWISG